MAKKRKKKDEEVVANCDHLDEPVAKYDQSKEEVKKFVENLQTAKKCCTFVPPNRRGGHHKG